MNRTQKIVLGFIVTMLGILSLVKSTGITQVNFEDNLYYLLQFIGLVFVFTSMGKNKRGILFLGSVLFMWGVIWFVKDNYEILNLTKIVIPSILISIGAGFFLLYIDNLKESIFLVLSLVLFGVTILFILFTKDHPVILTADRVALNILGFWPVLIALVGIGLLLNRNGK